MKFGPNPYITCECFHQRRYRRGVKGYIGVTTMKCNQTDRCCLYRPCHKTICGSRWSCFLGLIISWNNIGKYNDHSMDLCCFILQCCHNQIPNYSRLPRSSIISGSNKARRNEERKEMMSTDERSGSTVISLIVS